MSVQNRKRIHIVGGGTVSYVRTHFALATPAYGTTAREIAAIACVLADDMDVHVHLTKMADPSSSLNTIEDMRGLVKSIHADPYTKIVFWNPAIVDFEGRVGSIDSGKYAKRLRTRDNAPLSMQLKPAPKLVSLFRKGGDGLAPRKDIFLVAFKATANATEDEQYLAGLHMLKESSANIVLANDVVTKRNMVIVPEEARYHVTTNRKEALRGLVEMALARSRLHFTQSTVVPGEPVSWASPRVPETLRTVVDHCIKRGAYKPFRGVTAGHFAIKLGNGEFLTSRRKHNFNHLDTVGLVRVVAKDRDSVTAYGSKPSVGGQSQRIVFEEHPETDSIVHFHCPKKPDSRVPTVSQREYECGSHECGQNTSRGLRSFGNLKAVYLDEHGPNIVFSSKVDPQEVIDFIEANFDLDHKTGGDVAEVAA